MEINYIDIVKFIFVGLFLYMLVSVGYTAITALQVIMLVVAGVAVYLLFKHAKEIFKTHEPFSSDSTMDSARATINAISNQSCRIGGPEHKSHEKIMNMCRVYIKSNNGDSIRDVIGGANNNNEYTREQNKENVEPEVEPEVHHGGNDSIDNDGAFLDFELDANEYATQSQAQPYEQTLNQDDISDPSFTGKSFNKRVKSMVSKISDVGDMYKRAKSNDTAGDDVAELNKRKRSQNKKFLLNHHSSILTSQVAKPPVCIGGCSRVCPLPTDGAKNIEFFEWD